MAMFNDVEFAGGIVRLDGNEFHGCTFRDVRLDYGAVAPFVMAGCALGPNVAWNFVEHAALAFDAVRKLAADGWDAVDLLRLTGLERPPLDDIDFAALEAELGRSGA